MKTGSLRVVMFLISFSVYACASEGGALSEIVSSEAADGSLGDPPEAEDAGSDPVLDSGVPQDAAAAASDASAVQDAGLSQDAGQADAGPNVSCENNLHDGLETDVDCGGGCDPCENGDDCVQDSDCLSARCESSACASPSATHEDIVKVLSVPGRNPGSNWSDSYSVGTRCYCESTFDHDIGEIEVETPVGTKTVMEICTAIGPGPGSSGRPLYNDIQCGNGPANNAGDEDDCPGRVDIGREGCGHVGPKWDLSGL